VTDFVNGLKDAVNESLDSLVRISGGTLVRLSGQADSKVLLRREIDFSHVSLIAGGGSGHEPSHSGFIGHGMLTAAVAGEIFASPSVAAIYETILSVTGPNGCLLIVKNYMGDRLNFGLAAERARRDGLKVEMVIVSDDIAIENVAQPRGLAGTLFVHKIAGALAEDGANLEEIYKIAGEVASRVKTIGVAVKEGQALGRDFPKRILDGQIELGLGIHGEPGFVTKTFQDSKSLVQELSELLECHLPKKVPLALLINNLGGVSNIEMGIILNDLSSTEIGKRSQLLIGPASLMTSINAKGFSISALPLDPELKKALEHPVAAETYWPHLRKFGEMGTSISAQLAQNQKSIASENHLMRLILKNACTKIITLEGELNTIDSKVGDGDTGATFAAGANAILQKLNDLPLNDLGKLLEEISETLAASMGGTSGILLSIFLERAAGEFVRTGDIVESMCSGLVQLQLIGGAVVGDRTMVDCIFPALVALKHKGIEAMIDSARSGAIGTAKMTSAKVGRSSYINQINLRDNLDPGAYAMYKIIESVGNTILSFKQI
jgi:triose/dihydroxyacetone kinase / FAD-AMP lyase (cyclizing)